MEWLKGVQTGLQAAQKQAQEAAQMLIQSEAASKARELAQAASIQARSIAEQATQKAKVVAMAAAEGAEKGFAELRAEALAKAPTTEEKPPPDPLQYGITHDLEQFARSLTYSTFSDFPVETLPINVAPVGGASRVAGGGGRLTAWQETHALLMLERVQQLQDLRFVLCPRRMDEYIFWQVYFTLCRRYLPSNEIDSAGGGVTDSSEAVASSTAQAPARSAAAEPVHSGMPPQVPPGLYGAARSAGAPAAAAAAAAGAAGAAAGAAAVGDDAPGGSDAGEQVDDADLADLEQDPELNAYLQEALHVTGDGAESSGGGGGDDDADVGDLDEFINQLDAELK